MHSWWQTKKPNYSMYIVHFFLFRSCISLIIPDALLMRDARSARKIRKGKEGKSHDVGCSIRACGYIWLISRQDGLYALLCSLTWVLSFFSLTSDTRQDKRQEGYARKKKREKNGRTEVRRGHVSRWLQALFRAWSARHASPCQEISCRQLSTECGVLSPIIRMIQACIAYSLRKRLYFAFLAFDGIFYHSKSFRAFSRVLAKDRPRMQARKLTRYRKKVCSMAVCMPDSVCIGSLIAGTAIK